MPLRLSSSNSPTMISVWGGFPCNGLGWARRLYDCHSLPSYLEEELFVPVVLVWYRCFLSLILSILRPLRIYLSAPGMQSTLYITNKSLPTTVQS